jgi:hypothetical protein
MDNNMFENTILEKVKDLLCSLNNQFLEKGITYLIQLKKDEDNSEIEIVFYKDGDFIDIIEFFVYRNGSVYVKEETLIKELFSDFEEILSSN